MTSTTNRSRATLRWPILLAGLLAAGGVAWATRAAAAADPTPFKLELRVMDQGLAVTGSMVRALTTDGNLIDGITDAHGRVFLEMPTGQVQDILATLPDGRSISVPAPLPLAPGTRRAILLADVEQGTAGLLLEPDDPATADDYATSAAALDSTGSASVDVLAGSGVSGPTDVADQDGGASPIVPFDSGVSNLGPPDGPDTCATPQPLTSGVPVNAAIGIVADQDFYSIDLVCGDTIRIDLIPGTKELAGQIDLFSDTTCTTILTGGSAGNFGNGTPVQLLRTVYNSGTYRIRVASTTTSSPSSYGAYVLTATVFSGPCAPTGDAFESGDACDTPRLLVNNQLDTRAIASSADLDHYNFSWTCGEVIGFAVSPANTTLTPKLELYSPTKACATASSTITGTAGDPLTAAFLLTDPKQQGTWTARISSSPQCQALSPAACAGQGGTYRGDGTACAANVCTPSPSLGACCLSNNQCVLSTQAGCNQQSGTYHGDSTACGSGVCLPSPPQVGACCIPTTGPYRLLFTRATTTLCDNDSFEPDDDPNTQARPLPISPTEETHRWALASDGTLDQDWYSISLNCGDRLIVRTRSAGVRDVSTTLSLYKKPNSTTIVATSLPGSGGAGFSLLDFTASTAGDYWVKVTAAAPGAYAISGELRSGRTPLQLSSSQTPGPTCTALTASPTMNKVTGYTVTSAMAPLIDISEAGSPGGGTRLSLGDDTSRGWPIGFDFKFYDDLHSTVTVSSNGFLSFGTMASVTGKQNQCPTPNAASPNDLIAPFWDDLAPHSFGGVLVRTLPGPPRQFIVQWDEVPVLGTSSSRHTFQVILTEGTNTIEYRYGTLTGATTSDGSSATVAIENRLGSLATQVSCNTAGSVVTGLSRLFTPVETNLPYVPAPAPPGPYTLTTDTASFIDISATGVDLALEDEKMALGVPIGFSFNYYGVSYTTMNVSSNGWVSFVGMLNNFYNACPLIQPLAPHSELAPYWDDLDNTSSGGPWRQVIGTQSIVMWKNVPLRTGGGSYNFEVILNQTSNTIEFRYDTSTQGAEKATPSIGITAGTTGVQVNCNATSPIVPPSTRYTFTPPAAPNPATLTCQWIKPSTGAVYATGPSYCHPKTEPCPVTLTCTALYDEAATGCPVTASQSISTCNNPPVAVAGGAYASTCTTVALSGASGQDPDGDALSYAWSSSNPAVSVVPPNGSLPGPGTAPRPITGNIVSTSACNVSATLPLTVTDSYGASSIQTTQVTFNDDIQPTLNNVPADVSVQCTALPPVPTNVTASDTCDPNPAVTFSQVQSGGSCPYVLTRTWTARDACNNLQTASQQITLFDNVQPTLNNVPANVTVPCGAVPPVPTNVTASDTCDPSPTVTFNEVQTGGPCPYVLARTWTARDACNNVRTATQLITVVDTIQPTLNNVPANVTVSCDAVPPVPSNVSALDNCDPNPTVTFSQAQTGGSCPDSYSLARTWTARDACNNVRTATQLITVVDSTPPVVNSLLQPLAARPPQGPHSVCAPPSMRRFRVEGSALDRCDASPLVGYKIRVLNQGVINGTCSQRIEDFVVSPSETVEIRLLPNLCPVRPPKKPQVAMSVISGTKVFTGQNVSAVVTSTDRCGNSASDVFDPTQEPSPLCDEVLIGGACCPALAQPPDPKCRVPVCGSVPFQLPTGLGKGREGLRSRPGAVR